LLFSKSNLRRPGNDGETRLSLNILKECGYARGLTQLLVSDENTGIVGDEIDVARRQKLFGANKIILPRITSISDLMASQFEDPNVIKLIIAATIYLFFHVWDKWDDTIGYIEALTIYSGVFFAAGVSAIADYVKETQFNKIADEVNSSQVMVYRGNSATVQAIMIKDLVVGDVIDIQ
jgi:magnesium-transporting ATPase (P-type)